jgi:hypothetical protein
MYKELQPKRHEEQWLSCQRILLVKHFDWLIPDSKWFVVMPNFESIALNPSMIVFDTLLKSDKIWIHRAEVISYSRGGRVLVGGRLNR